MGRPGKSKSKQPKLKAKQVSSSTANVGAAADLQPVGTQQENIKAAPTSKNTKQQTSGSKNHMKH
jgi:hypothetical protein